MHELSCRNLDIGDVGPGNAGNPADQRDAPRHTLLIRSAKLIALGAEYLCVLRDASETGVSMRLFHPLPDCGSMLLELQNEDRHEIEPVWQDADRAGFRFVRRVNVARIIESPNRFGRRPIRVRLKVPATVTSLTQSMTGELLDISQHGAKLAGPHSFAVHQRVKLQAPGLPEVVAKVRWRRAGLAGLVFENTFEFGELARIVAAMQHGGDDRVLGGTAL